MKSLFIISKNKTLSIAALLIIMAGTLVFGLPVIYGHGGGGGDDDAGYRNAGEATSYVYIPLLNNHYPTIATIYKMHLTVPGTMCSYSHMNWNNLTILKEIKFGDTVAYQASSGFCCCSRSGHSYGTGYTHTFNRNGNKYEFSDPKVLCRVGIDQSSVPSGSYTLTFYYKLPGDSGFRTNELTFTLP